jgi:hypothetical protein
VDGQVVQQWVVVKNPQLKHINLCLNELDDEIFMELVGVMERTSDDFELTISSNRISEEVVE